MSLSELKEELPGPGFPPSLRDDYFLFAVSCVWIILDPCTRSAWWSCFSKREREEIKAYLYGIRVRRISRTTGLLRWRQSEGYKLVMAEREAAESIFQSPPSKLLW